jgi:hypothetical protein
LVRIGSTRPLSRKQVCPSLRPGGNTCLQGEGAGGANSDDWRESLALFLLCGAGIRTETSTSGWDQATKRKNADRKTEDTVATKLLILMFSFVLADIYCVDGWMGHSSLGRGRSLESVHTSGTKAWKSCKQKFYLGLMPRQPYLKNLNNRFLNI